VASKSWTHTPGSWKVCALGGDWERAYETMGCSLLPFLTPLGPAGLLDASALEKLAAEEDSDKARALGLTGRVGLPFALCTF
jgi:hypothetical protein